MNKIILSLLFTLALLNSAVAAQGNVDAGKVKSAMCAGCHGIDGNSLVPMYPKLAGQNASYLAKQLADFKVGATSGGKDGRNDPIMAGMVMALSAVDMADLAAYFSAQTTTQNATSNKTTSGEKIYLGGDSDRGIPACAGCHGIKGGGMASAGFPALASQNSEYIKNQLMKFRAASRANDKNAMMRHVAAELSDNEIIQLAQHTASLK
ncbi:MAG: cytochrome c4 [Gammaproteobacteria bacterium]|nr:MAG: cytochrome c4 [Gammaproteobacteria bacterium]